MKYYSRFYCSLFLAFIYLFTFCQRKSGKELKPEQHNPKVVLPAGNTAHLTGRQLAQGYCQSCHLFPEPDLLPKKVWQQGVLPNMALRLGLGDSFGLLRNVSYTEIPTLIRAGVFPDKPLISKQDWSKIEAYYLSQAPAEPLPQRASLKVKPVLALFTPQPFFFKKRKIPVTTLVKYDTAHNRIFLADQKNNLYIFNSKFELLDSLLLESPAADIFIKPNGSFDVLSIGVLDPSDRYAGKLTHFSRSSVPAYIAQPVLDSLNRPVEATYVDLNQDNLQDIIICNYGNYTGKLVWFRNTGNNSYEEKILKEIPGTRNVIIRDFNHDGQPDIMALAAQATEGVFIFFNQGQGKFKEKLVLQFPPVYGSSYVDVADFNNDGAPDILYANGDNADYSVSLKRYHGLRLFLNDGKNNFKQAWFYPMHGASKAIARDFDQDGDQDIAAIAFFPDFEKQPQNGFVYLENKGNLKFTPATFKEATSGRWLTLENADVDQDGDQDLMLGSFISAPAKVPPAIQKSWFMKGPNLLILVNNKRLRNNTGL